MKFHFFAGEKIDKGVVLFNLSNLYRVPDMQKRFVLREKSDVRIVPSQSTIIPHMLKQSDYEFIDHLSSAELNVPVKYEGNEGLFSRFDEFFEQPQLISEKELRKAQSAWSKVKANFLSVLNQLFANVDEKVTHVDVYVTHYGHSGSYCYHKNEKSIAVYWNVGVPLITVAYLVIQALVHIYNYQKWLRKEPAFIKSGLWHNKVSIATVLSNLPMMAKIFGEKIDSAWLYTDVVQSPDIIQKLRLPENKCEIELSNPVTINGIAIRNLTQSEDKLLRTLAENRGQLVATAKIAKTLWQEDASSKFSVYYFPKLVFTLRKKLVAAGISPKLVKSQSGAGYYIE